MTRRNLLQRVSLAGAVTAGRAMAQAGASKAFPKDFLWGCATAGHQVEGNNVNSDCWLLEHLPNSVFEEPSGDACDHYHLYAHDIQMLADLGFNTYRFSIEWSRIEPEEGFFSHAELEHYRRVLGKCHEAGVTPMVTYSHFTTPRWFAMNGGWESQNSSDSFARYCEKATRHLGDLIAYASTFNEPDVPRLLDWLVLPGMTPDTTLSQQLRSGLARVREQVHSPRFSSFFMGDPQQTIDNVVLAHTKGKAAIKSVRSSIPVGLTLAMSDDQSAGPDSRIADKRASVYGPYLELAKKDDYLGVQTYTRAIVAQRNLPPPKGSEVTQSGYEFYPEALEHTIRYASKQTGIPVIVTENGVAETNDERRVEYIRRALAGVKKCLDDRVDVRGYIAWSLLDNFEWDSGYKPKFGLVAVDRETQRRTIKPSAVFLGNIARSNSL